MKHLTRWTVGSSWIMIVLVAWLLFVPAVVNGATLFWTNALVATMVFGAWALTSRSHGSQTIAEVLYDAEAGGTVRK